MDPRRSIRVQRSDSGSPFEGRFEWGVPEFYLPLRGNDAAAALEKPMLQRAIGFIYLPRTERMSHYFHASRFATLLLDLLTPSEEAIDARDAQLRFNIEMLAQRLVGTVDWLAEQPEAGHLPIGFFGASTGGAAALVAAAEVPERVAAVVSRGGRPDLAGDALPHVKAPTLLIVGGDDVPVIEMNSDALARMTCAREMTIVPGASHLFEEPGKLETVAGLARKWFARHLNEA